MKYNNADISLMLKLVLGLNKRKLIYTSLCRINVENLSKATRSRKAFYKYGHKKNKIMKKLLFDNFSASLSS